MEIVRTINLMLVMHLINFILEFNFDKVYELIANLC